MSAENWLDKSAVARLEGCSAREVERRAAAGEIESRTGRTKSANGKVTMECSIRSLSAEAQLRLAREQLTVAESDGTTALALRTETALQPALFGAPDERHELIPNEVRLKLTPQQDKEAQRRADIIEPVLKWKNKEFPVSSFKFQDGRAIQNSNDLVAWLSEQHGVSRSTIWAWVKAFRTKGWVGLVDAPRADRNVSRFFERSREEGGHPEAAKFVLAKYAENLTMRAIYRALEREWPELSDRFGYHDNCCDYSTVRDFLYKMPEALRDVTRLRRDKWDAKHAPFLRSAYVEPPNDTWISDHRIFDVFVWNDLWPHAKAHAAMRIWCTAIEDRRSRVIVGQVWAPTPSSRTISSALRAAITRFGLPTTFYVDNGKDYRKIGKGAVAVTPEDLDEYGRVRLATVADGLLRRLGIAAKYCIPKHPQSKQIESYFSTVSRNFDVMFGGAYAGRASHLRSDECRAALKLHELWMRGERKETPLLPASEFIQLANYWTEEFNRTHKHSGRGMNGRTPLEIFDELLPEAQRKQVEIAELEPLFWDQQTRRVTNCTVQLFNETYEGADEASVRRLFLANGGDIRVACDPTPTNVGVALAFNLDGEFIARLRCQALTIRGPQSHEQIKAISKLRHELRKKARQFSEVLRSGVPSELEFLRGRAVAAGAECPLPQISPPTASGPSRRQLTAAAAAGGGRPVFIDDVVAELKD